MKRTFKAASIFITATIFPLSVQQASAKPASPYPIDYVQPDNSIIKIILEGDENHHTIRSLDGTLLELTSDGFMRPALLRSDMNNESRPKKYIFSGTPFPSEGEPHALVILVNFNDSFFSMAEPLKFFNNLLNQEGFSTYGATGSARDFFIENSGGQFRPYFDVYGPITLRERTSYYGANDIYGYDLHPEEMCIEACQQLDSMIDFSRYDLDGDGYIDNLFIFYAGQSESDTGKSTLIWPHSANIEDFALDTVYSFDGKILNRYAMSNEIDASYQRPDGIGTFVHEFSHVLGLPDLYSTVYNGAVTPGHFSTMDTGSYNNQGRTPPYYSIFERMSLGWLQPSPLPSDGSCIIDPIHISNSGYIISTEKEDEFFLFECRKLEGSDKFIPAEGMLVWHIDFDQKAWDDNIVNNTPSHQRVDIIEADNVVTTFSRSGDTFPGSKNVTELSFNTAPQLKTWNNESTGFILSEITRKDSGQISFKTSSHSTGMTGISNGNPDLDSFRVENNRLINISDYSLSIYRPDGSFCTVLNPGASVSLEHSLYLIISPEESRKLIIR